MSGTFNVPLREGEIVVDCPHDKCETIRFLDEGQRGHRPCHGVGRVERTDWKCAGSPQAGTHSGVTPVMEVTGNRAFFARPGELVRTRAFGGNRGGPPQMGG